MRSLLVPATALLALLVPTFALPSTATAVVVKVGSAEVGAQPRNVESVHDGNGTLGASFANDAGNPVLHGSATYSIFWDPTNSYHGDWQHLINGFLQNMGGASGELENVFAVEEQYTDRSNAPAANATVFKGAYTDTDGYPGSGCTDPNPFAEEDQLLLNNVHTPVCLTDSQVREELKKFLAAHKLPTGMGSVYYLLTPPGVTLCLDGGAHCSDFSGSVGATSYKNSFCSYHGAINPGGLATGDANTVLYAAIPWSAGGLADPHLLGGDQRVGYDCQDGGFDPTSKPIEEHEESPREQQPNQVKCPSIDGGCDTGLADVEIGQIAVEQQNIVTNPLLNAWQDTSHNEATDECRNFFAPKIGGTSGAEEESLAGTLFNQSYGGNYYLQMAFDLAAFTFSYPGVPCVPGVTLEPQFTSPNPVNSGELVGFDGMESAITLNAGTKFPASGSPSATYPTYTWNFGDGSPTVSGFAPGAPSQNSPETSPCETPWLPPCAASAYHSYQYGGTYDVTLTVKDVGGNTASVTDLVTVDGPAPPAPPAPTPEVTKTGTGSGSDNGSASPNTANSGGDGAGSSPASVVATQAVATHSLSAALKGGLVVNYSVDGRAAGRFEVLLAKSVAKKIGLSGAAATGLAKGTPAQIVIAKAILVTTKAGHSSYRIKFSKATAAKLRKLRKVSLMIRLVVHNASSPVATTVLSTATLGR
jgi:hypothetical protein